MHLCTSWLAALLLCWVSCLTGIIGSGYFCSERAFSEGVHDLVAKLVPATRKLWQKTKVSMHSLQHIVYTGLAHTRHYLLLYKQRCSVQVPQCSVNSCYCLSTWHQVSVLLFATGEDAAHSGQVPLHLQPA